MISKTITTTNIKKFFDSEELLFTTVTGSANEIDLIVDLSKESGESYIIADLTACGDNEFTLDFTPGDYLKSVKAKHIELISEAMNIIPVTGLEVKNYNNRAHITLTALTNGALSSSATAPKFAVVTFTPVVSH